MQSINVLSSTEAEIINTVISVKTDGFLMSMLWEIGFTQESNTPIYEDNDITIDILDSSITTERTRHIDVRLFSI